MEEQVAAREAATAGELAAKDDEERLHAPYGAMEPCYDECESTSNTAEGAAFSMVVDHGGTSSYGINGGEDPPPPCQVRDHRQGGSMVDGRYVAGRCVDGRCVRAIDGALDRTALGVHAIGLDARGRIDQGVHSLSAVGRSVDRDV